MKKQIALIIISMLAVMPAGAKSINNTQRTCIRPETDFKCTYNDFGFSHLTCTNGFGMCNSCADSFFFGGLGWKDYNCFDDCFNPCIPPQMKPEAPDTPIIPDEPEVPDTPIVPDEPEVPDTPIVPDIPIVPEEPDNGETEENTPGDAEIAKLFALVNNERVRNGIAALTYDEALEMCANVRSVEIKSLFSHTRPNGQRCFTVLDEYGYDYSTAGENIAYGQESAVEVFEAWMNSEGHRENILSPSFTRIGMSCYESGTLYWAQMFASK